MLVMKIRPALGKQLALALLLSGFLLFRVIGAAEGQETEECLVIADAESGEIIFRHGICNQRFTPGSTFKLPLALIGFDAGILENEHQPAWDYRPEFQADLRSQKTVDPTIWLQESIVWYSQQITRSLGRERLEGYLALFDYGNMDLSGEPGQNNGLTHAWLSSSLLISPDEQTAFIGRFLKKRLGLSEQAYQLTEAITPRFETAGWTVHGKTGSGWRLDSSGQRDPNRPLGWFVGWAEKNAYRVIFARLEINGSPTNVPASQIARDHLLAELPKIVGEP